MNSMATRISEHPDCPFEIATDAWRTCVMTWESAKCLETWPGADIFATTVRNECEKYATLGEYQRITASNLQEKLSKALNEGLTGNTQEIEALRQQVQKKETEAGNQLALIQEGTGYLDRQLTLIKKEHKDTKKQLSFSHKMIAGLTTFFAGTIIALAIKISKLYSETTKLTKEHQETVKQFKEQQSQQEEIERGLAAAHNLGHRNDCEAIIGVIKEKKLLNTPVSELRRPLVRQEASPLSRSAKMLLEQRIAEQEKMQRTRNLRRPRTATRIIQQLRHELNRATSDLSDEQARMQ